jgi:hypothetical protein
MLKADFAVMLRTRFEQAILDACQSDRLSRRFERGVKLRKRALTAGRGGLLQNIAEWQQAAQQAALIFHRCTLPASPSLFLAGPPSCCQLALLPAIWQLSRAGRPALLLLALSVREEAPLSCRFIPYVVLGEKIPNGL